MGSTDMGNVSQVVPGLHPYVPIAGEGVAGHTEAFAEAARSPMGHEGLIVAAKALAMTAVDLLADPALVEAAWAAFKSQKAEQQS
jgi:metal-dependent amidase/aminoacylase/carboxypeptidase family protein